MVSGYSVNIPSISNSNLKNASGSHSKSADFQAQQVQRVKNEIANISDDEILFSSLHHADKEAKNTKASKVLKAITPLFIVAVPALYGAMQKGTIIKDGDKIIKSNVLSTKVGSAVSTAAVFAGANTILNGADNLFKRVSDNVSSVEKFKEKHPALSFAAGLGAKALILTGACIGVYKGKNYLANKFQPTAKQMADSISKAADKIDSTKLAAKVTKMSDKFNKFASKHPKVSRCIEQNSFLFPLLGWMALTTGLQYKVESNKYKIAEETANDLIQIRDNARNA